MRSLRCDNARGSCVFDLHKTVMTICQLGNKRLHVRTDCAKTQQHKLPRASKTRVLRAVTFGS